VQAGGRDGRLLIERDFHMIADELRQWFQLQREGKARSAVEELDPSQPEQTRGVVRSLTLAIGVRKCPKKAAGARGSANRPARPEQAVAAAL
jgi:hypothetical protein